MSNNKPKHFLVFKIIGFVGVAAVIAAMVFIFTGIGNFESKNFLIGGMLLPFGILSAVIGLAIGFRPESARLSMNTAKYIQEENKKTLTDIADNTADIMSGAVKKTAGAMAEGFQDSMFCKHCGAEIDQDSTFCKKCGKQQ